MATDQATELPASHRDLLEAPGVGALATIGPDGHPQVTAVWYLLDDGALKLTMRDTRQKAKNLQSRPRATLFLLDPDNPYRTLEIRGTVGIAPDPDYAFADRVGNKYGADLRALDTPGDHRIVVTLHPLKINRRD
jgi:PPOX class probable F420-dependent enzyme